MLYLPLAPQHKGNIPDGAGALHWTLTTPRFSAGCPHCLRRLASAHLSLQRSDCGWTEVIIIACMSLGRFRGATPGIGHWCYRSAPSVLSFLPLISVGRRVAAHLPDGSAYRERIRDTVYSVFVSEGIFFYPLIIRGHSNGIFKGITQKIFLIS